MKLRIEIDPDCDEEIVIKAQGVTDKIRRLQETIDREMKRSEEIAMRKDGKECYLLYSDLLFFETDGNRVTAHTADECFVVPLRLNELEMLIPRTFARASKSCIVNTAYIKSISRSPTGVSTAAFAKSDKIVLISRMYYKIVREIIEETRLK